MRRALLCRYGEIFLKSGNRKRFEGILRDNVRRALKGVRGADVRKTTACRGYQSAHRDTL